MGDACLDIFSFVQRFSFLSPSLWQMALAIQTVMLAQRAVKPKPTSQPVGLVPFLKLTQIYTCIEVV